MGKKFITVDWKLIEKLCEIKCTHEEISAVTGITIDTLNERCKEDHKMTFQKYLKSKGQVGNVSLRRAMYISAIHDKNVQMLKFLAKSPAWLGMTETTNIQLDDPAKLLGELAQGLKDQDDEDGR